MRPVWAVLLAAAAGCAAPTRYEWGTFEHAVYLRHSRPESLSVVDELAALEKDRQTALSTGKPLPPGWRLHLAAIYAASGRREDARAALLQEKETFPESATLVAHFLKRLDAPERAR